eukprot:CAMPEP_0115065406 /NCGR_PEP_ID=MMETSP0227-20121206/10234_1 /TAXON_ID=89957 /ORGANISM="Polarella glacialis, Strain CCMP 1383" /LENGTH=41 /DNA_ID= /DNA_START= /DNA_END= /DNA_ORIENTATION=
MRSIQADRRTTSSKGCKAILRNSTFTASNKEQAKDADESDR